MSDQGKKRKIVSDIQIFKCCICGKSGIEGFSDASQLSLRENQLSLSFLEVIFYVVGVHVQKESSDICAACKPKIIEFYHFKKRSQSLQENFSPLLQEIMKIVGNYVTKYAINAVTIEESKEKLTIMEKCQKSNLKISGVSSVCDLLVKEEPIDENDIIPENEIKKEPPEKDDTCEIPTCELPPITRRSDEYFNVSTGENCTDKLDAIFNLNMEILQAVRSLRNQNDHDNIFI